MLDSRGFDLWADGYDAAVGLSDESDAYPFAGYRRVLGRIYETVLAAGRPKVLDIGFGTATLTSKLYERGCGIWGQDFSGRMIELARQKMPGAHLYRWDFSAGLHPELMAARYDFIVATYSLHHLDDARKVALMRALLPLIEGGGQLLIGDVAFRDRAALERCRQACGDDWDDDEIYFVYDEMREAFPNMCFEQISHCAGIMSIKP